MAPTFGFAMASSSSATSRWPRRPPVCAARSKALEPTSAADLRDGTGGWWVFTMKIMGKSWENHGKIGNLYVFEGFEEFVPRQIGEMWSFLGGKTKGNWWEMCDENWDLSGVSCQTTSFCHGKFGKCVSFCLTNKNWYVCHGKHMASQQHLWMQMQP